MAKLNMGKNTKMTRAVIVDKSNPDHVDVPDTLDGQVILKVDEHGSIHSCTYDIAAYMKTLDPRSRTEGGWDEFQGILDTLPPVKPGHAPADPDIDNFKQRMQDHINNRPAEPPGPPPGTGGGN